MKNAARRCALRRPWGGPHKLVIAQSAQQRSPAMRSTRARGFPGRLRALRGAFGSRGLLRGRGALARGSLARRGVRLSRKRFMGRGAMWFPLQRLAGCARALGRWSAFCRRAVASRVGALGALSRLLLRLALSRRRKIDSRLTSLRQPDRNRLFGRSGTVFPFANMMHLFADEFAGLRRRRLAFALVTAGAFQCFFFGHD